MPEHDGTQDAYDPAAEDYRAPAAKYPVVSERAVEPKAKAAGAGAGVGVGLSAFVVWAVDELFFDGADVAPEVPLPVVGLIGVIVTPLVAFASSYYARHVNRR